MKKYLCLIGVLGVLLCNTANSYAQKVAVKTNLLYDATTTMNLGLEIGLGKKWSLDLSGYRIILTDSFDDIFHV